MMEKFKAPKPRLLFLLVALSLAILTTSGKGEITTNQVPQNALNNPPSPGSVPFAEPVGGNNGQQSQLGQQQQQDPNNPQRTINQPLQMLAGWKTLISIMGFNQPFNTINQPFGDTINNPQGSMENADFYNGVTKNKSFIQYIVLVSLVSLLACFGF